VVRGFRVPSIPDCPSVIEKCANQGGAARCLAMGVFKHMNREGGGVQVSAEASPLSPSDRPNEDKAPVKIKKTSSRNLVRLAVNRGEGKERRISLGTTFRQALMRV